MLRCSLCLVRAQTRIPQLVSLLRSSWKNIVVSAQFSSLSRGLRLSRSASPLRVRQRSISWLPIGSCCCLVARRAQDAKDGNESGDESDYESDEDDDEGSELSPSQSRASSIRTPASSDSKREGSKVHDKSGSLSVSERACLPALAIIVSF